MDLHEIQAVSSTITESGLCMFSYQIEWVFKKGSISYNLEYRHFGLAPFEQVILDGKVISSGISIGLIINFAFLHQGMKLQIKKYKKQYNLLINGQDFELFVQRLKTIQEIQDEPFEECPKRAHLRPQMKIFSRKNIEYDGEMMFSAHSSQTINDFALNTNKLLNDELDETRKKIESDEVLMLLEIVKHDVFGFELSLVESLNKLNQKANRALLLCENQELMQNLQKIKLEINNIFEENMNSPLVYKDDSHNLEEFRSQNIKLRSNEKISQQKRH